MGACTKKCSKSTFFQQKVFTQDISCNIFLYPFSFVSVFVFCMFKKEIVLIFSFKGHCSEFLQSNNLFLLSFAINLKTLYSAKTFADR